MKFTPESLLQIYMDGSFTEEAQAEFNALVRKDPVFAEKVSRAVAARVGEYPESSLSQVESRLDGKMAELWEKHHPSPFSMLFKRAAGITAIFLGALGFYYLFHNYGRVFHWSATSNVTAPEPQTAYNTTVASVMSPKAPIHRVKKVPASGLKGSNFTQPAVSASEAGNVKSPRSLSSSSLLPPVSGVGSKAVQPIAASAPSRAVNGTGPSGLPPISNSGMAFDQNPAPAGQVNIVPPSIPGQVPAGLPAVEPALPSSRGGSSQTGEGDTLSVSIETQTTQNVLVTVLDSNGKQVRQLYQGQWNAGVHMINWDGKDDLSNPVLPGNYTVVVNSDGKTMSGVVTVQPNNSK